MIHVKNEEGAIGPVMYLMNTQVACELELSSKGFITEVEIASQAATRYSITKVPIGYRQCIGKSKLATINGFSILDWPLAAEKVTNLHKTKK